MKLAEEKAQALRKKLVVHSAKSTNVDRADLRTKYEADHLALVEADPLLELINSPDADMVTTGERSRLKNGLEVVNNEVSMYWSAFLIKYLVSIEQIVFEAGL
ncbi:unnamed protein product [Phytophthora lilii]|uniref:Unnamed protein product n=1 Tax=Phytophthora lilii TaxID=2077276 RepID=A0A9W6UDG4_9STRA|nr:unnamed protein product [Phytophthora lilii]